MMPRRNLQGIYRDEINEHERALANAKIIDESQLDTSKVTVLSKGSFDEPQIKERARVFDSFRI